MKSIRDLNNKLIAAINNSVSGSTGLIVYGLVILGILALIGLLIQFAIKELLTILAYALPYVILILVVVGIVYLLIRESHKFK